MIYLEARKNRSRLLTSSEIKYIGRGEAAATPENRLPPCCGMLRHRADKRTRHRGTPPASPLPPCARAQPRGPGLSVALIVTGRDRLPLALVLLSFLRYRSGHSAPA